jgi:hypothetical protein
MTEKPIGRPAPLGRKVPVGIRLTPEVVEFCKQHPDGFVFLETLCRKSKEFKAWAKTTPPQVDPSSR